MLHASTVVGSQIGRIADALDAKGLQSLADRVESIARRRPIDSCAVAAEQIETDL